MAGPSGGRSGGYANALMAASGPTTSSSAASQQMMLFCNGPTNMATQTIEEQIKQIDRISKVGSTFLANSKTKTAKIPIPIPNRFCHRKASLKFS